LKSSRQHNMPSAEPELFPMKGHRSDILGLFEEVLRNGTDLRVMVTGRSMRPFLRGGEVLTIRQTPSPCLRKGDLILFRSSYGLPVLHRVLNKRKTGGGKFRILTKGDALKAFDEEIHEDSVLGKVLRIERPLLSGKTRHIDMDSLYYRCVNVSVAVLGFFKTQTLFFLSKKHRHCSPSVH
jgi:signal peptidase I